MVITAFMSSVLLSAPPVSLVIKRASPVAAACCSISPYQKQRYNKSFIGGFLVAVDSKKTTTKKHTKPGSKRFVQRRKQNFTSRETSERPSARREGGVGGNGGSSTSGGASSGSKKWSHHTLTQVDFKRIGTLSGKQYTSFHDLSQNGSRPVIFVCADQEGSRFVKPWVEALGLTALDQQNKVTVMAVALTRNIPQMMKGFVKLYLDKFARDDGDRFMDHCGEFQDFLEAALRRENKSPMVAKRIVLVFCEPNGDVKGVFSYKQAEPEHVTSTAHCLQSLLVQTHGNHGSG